MKIINYTGKSIHLRIGKNIDILFKGVGSPKHYHISEVTPEIVGSAEDYAVLMKEVANAQHTLHSSKVK